MLYIIWNEGGVINHKSRQVWTVATARFYTTIETKYKSMSSHDVA